MKDLNTYLFERTNKENDPTYAVYRGWDDLLKYFLSKNSDKEIWKDKFKEYSGSLNRFKSSTNITPNDVSDFIKVITKEDHKDIQERIYKDRKKISEAVWDEFNKLFKLDDNAKENIKIAKEDIKKYLSEYKNKRAIRNDDGSMTYL